MATTREEIILRKPSKAEIDQITTSMVAQAQTRSMAHKAENNKASSMFIKKIDHKKSEIIKPKEVPIVNIKSTNKKWKPKRVEDSKTSEFQGNIPVKSEEKVSKALATNDKSHQTIAYVVDRHKEKKGMVNNFPSNSSIDMLSVLSQVIVKVPFSELL